MLLSTTQAVCAPPALTPSRTPIIIAHRGASGYRPEHTLAAYELAIQQGADFIEPDLVITKDGVLVARHENEISETTDVARHAEFADRKVTKKWGSRTVTGWFTEDFTLAELKSLRAVERLPKLRPKSAEYDGQFEIPTFEEVLKLARQQSATVGREIGVYPETKHPTLFEALGLPLERRLVEILNAHGYTEPESQIFIQSFEPSSLRKLRPMTQVRLIQLLGDRPPVELADTETGTPGPGWLTRAVLDRIKEYADGIGPDKSVIVPRDKNGDLLEPTSVVTDAHAAGLFVHPYTFRNENSFLPVPLRQGDKAAPGFGASHGDYAAEYQLFFRLGVDGLFSDFPDAAFASRREFLRTNAAR